MKQLFALFTISYIFLVSCTSNKPINPTTQNQTACDTSSLFKSRVEIIFQSKCYSCHGIGDTNFEMQPFAKLQSNVTKTVFLASIKHINGASAMPKGGSKLSDCDINAIEKWIMTGALEN